MITEIVRSLACLLDMSKQTELKSKQGQRAGEIQLHHSELTKHEQRLVDVLAKPGRPTLTIKELVIECKWTNLGKSRGNSRVRNTVRRLVKAKWIEHPEGIGDGLYRLTSAAKSRLKRLSPDKPKEEQAQAS